MSDVKALLTNLLKQIDSNKSTGNGDGIYLNTQVEVSVFTQKSNDLVKAGTVTVGDVLEIMNNHKAEKMLEYTPPAEELSEVDNNKSESTETTPVVITKAESLALLEANKDRYLINRVIEGSLNKDIISADYKHVIDIITSNRNENISDKTIQLDNGMSIKYDNHGRVEKVYDENGKLWLESDRGLCRFGCEHDEVNVKVFGFQDSEYANIPSCKIQFSTKSKEILAATIYNINSNNSKKDDYTVQSLTWDIKDGKFTYAGLDEYRNGLLMNSATRNFPEAKDTGIEDQRVWRQEYKYNKQGKLVEKRYYCDVNGKTDNKPDIETNKYDNRGNRIEHKDRWGHVTTYQYDSNDHLIKEEDEYSVITYEYDGNGVKTKGQRISKGDIYDDLTYIYNEDGKVIKMYEEGCGCSFESGEIGRYDIHKKEVNITYDENGRAKEEVVFEDKKTVELQGKKYKDLDRNDKIGDYLRSQWQ